MKSVSHLALAFTLGAASLSPAQDSADSAPPVPALEAPVAVVNLNAKAGFSAQSVHAGDSLDYVLTVEWPETGVPVVVLAPDSLEFQGFKVLGSATSHKKVAVPDAQGRVAGLVNQSVFTWRLRADLPGSGKATAVKLRYLTGLTRNEENRFVPSSHLDILAARVAVTDRLWFRLLAGWLGLAAAGGLAYAAFQVGSRRKAAKQEPARSDLKPEALAIKARLKSAAVGAAGASRGILEGMEALAIRHLSQELAPAAGKGPGEAPPQAQAMKFEPLLDRYLAARGISEGEAADWKALRDLFRHARFAGGHKEPHELQDAWRTFKRCLKITDEPGDD